MFKLQDILLFSILLISAKHDLSFNSCKQNRGVARAALSSSAPGGT